jgi:hypothetical protein
MATHVYNFSFFHKSIIYITDSPFFYYLLYIFSISGIYHILDQYFIFYLVKIIEFYSSQKLTLTGINSDQKLNKNSKLFINFMQNNSNAGEQSSSDQEVSSNNQTGETKGSFLDVIKNNSNSSNSNQNSGAAGVSRSPSPQNNSAEVGSSSDQEVSSNDQTEVPKSPGNFSSPQQNNVSQFVNPNQTEGNWHYFKKGFYPHKDYQNRKKYFDGGYAFIPKGSDINVFSGTHVNKESPTFLTPFIDPNFREGSWHYFKKGFYPDKTLEGRKRRFEGGFVFLPKNSDNGVWSAIQHSKEAPPFPVTDSSNLSREENLPPKKRIKITPYTGALRTEYENVKEGRVFDKESAFEKIREPDKNRILETLLSIFNDDLRSWFKIDNKKSGFSRHNTEYNKRLSEFKILIVQEIRSLHIFEDRYNKQEMSKDEFEQKKANILAAIYSIDERWKNFKNKR